MHSIEYMVTGITLFLTFTIAVAAITGVVTSSLNYSAQQTLQAYAQSNFESILTNTGSPSNWGATFSDPKSFGLAATGRSNYNLDSSKLLRLSGTYPFPISYSYAQNSLGLSNVYKFRISFLQPLAVSVALIKNAAANTITVNVQVNDINGRPVPLTQVTINTLIYTDVIFNPLKNWGAYVSFGAHFGWRIYNITDPTSGATFNVASILASMQTNELGVAPFLMDLNAIFKIPNMVSHVPLVVVIGRSTLANIAVPFGFWQGDPGIRLHVFSSTDVSGFIMKDSSVTPSTNYVIVYDSTNNPIFQAVVGGSKTDVGVLVTTPTQTDIAYLYQATAWTSQNGHVIKIPLLGSGAPIQALFTFNTIQSGTVIRFQDILFFVDPLLLLSSTAASQPLTFGPSLGQVTSIVQLQRFVLVDGYSYIVQFWFWK